MTGATVGLYDHFDLFLLSCTRDYHCWGSSLLALLSWRVDLSQATSARSDSCSRISKRLANGSFGGDRDLNSRTYSR